MTEPKKTTAEPVKATAEPVKGTAEPVKGTAEIVKATTKPVKALSEPMMFKPKQTQEKKVVVRKTKKMLRLQRLFPECELLLQSDFQHVLHPTVNKPITLGRGAYGVVTLMKNMKTGRLCAVKTFQNHLRNAKIFKNAKLEIQMLTKLRGLKCVPELFGIVPAEGNTGVPSVVQEFIGEQNTLKTWTLQAALKKKILSTAAIVRIALSIVKALIDVHSRGVLHCDLKPDNIMLMPGFQNQKDPQIKIIDFGKAVNMADKPKYEHFRPKRQAEVLKRCYHIDPAVISGTMPYTEYSEIYSLGMMFMQMAGNQIPYLKYTGEMCVNRTLFKDQQWTMS
ncbi:hypothetical protein BSL78_12444 [Apostichopus japonicus]|uniref:Protein kinase domain-containing protein n=1 Tax=Stichopus japonicus TaxID=307972 RepID=A0A2G8KRP4_STIJA|nr:hypothetical protein BSL78_12444 [Apostichopus japonicus]